MYDSLFLTGNGTNIFTTLGFLSLIEKKIQDVRYWNITGNVSLIIFLKIVGYNYGQIFEILEKFKLTVDTINCSSLIPEKQEKKIEYVQEWLSQALQNSEFFSKDIRLSEIYKKTNIFPCFILWSRTNQKIVNINPDTCPSFKLVDCVMASLCFIGLYKTYKMMGEEFSNISSINCYPMEYAKLGDESLFIGTISETLTSKKDFLGPLASTEEEIIRQFGEREKVEIERLSKEKKDLEFVKIFSSYRRGKISREEKLTLFKSGKKQGKAFLNKQDTELEKKNFVTTIEGQP